MIPMKECKERRVYKIRSRNLTTGVYDGKGGFVGIRTKFRAEYLFTEFHHDQGSPFGTVSPIRYIGIDLPENISLKEMLGTVDEYTGKDVYYKNKPKDSEKPYGDGWGWAFFDNSKVIDRIRPIGVNNDELFDFISNINSTDEDRK